MSLLDDLTDPNFRTRKGPRCGVSLALIDMPKDIAAKLNAAMANPHAPSTKIAEAAAELGYRIPADTVQRHRRGACSCGSR
jgi:hypothetical protein